MNALGTIGSVGKVAVHWDTRRSFLKAVAVAFAASAAEGGLAEKAQAVPAAGGVATTEGIFLIAEKEERVFFISSVWLPYFEVTNLLADETELNQVTYRGRKLRDKEKWTVLYSDDEDVPTKDVTTKTVLPFPPPRPPGPTETYLAMSISPPVL